MEEYRRNIALYGEEVFHKLQQLHVMILGVGGVGSHAAEALARLGVGQLTFVDFDSLNPSNANRHVQYKSNRVGMSKALAMKEHLKETMPGCLVHTLQERIHRENLDLLEGDYHWYIDAIDLLGDKLDLIEALQTHNKNFITALGMGNRLDPSQVYRTTLFKTENDPLARNLRREARKRELHDFPVVASRELPKKVVADQQHGRHAPASVYLVPAAAGLQLAFHILEQTCQV